MRIKPYHYPEAVPDECQVCGGARLPVNHDCTYVASYQELGNGWRGVIRDRISREIVAVCLGTYRNRDQGISATSAARELLMALQAGGYVR